MNCIEFYFEEIFEFPTLPSCSFLVFYFLYVVITVPYNFKLHQYQPSAVGLGTYSNDLTALLVRFYHF